MWTSRPHLLRVQSIKAVKSVMLVSGPGLAGGLWFQQTLAALSLLTYSNLQPFNPDNPPIKSGLLPSHLRVRPSAVCPMGGGATRLYGSVTFGSGAPPLPPNPDPDFCQVRHFSAGC